MRFEYPKILWLLLVAVPGLALFFWWAGQARRRLMLQFISARLLPGLSVGVSATRQKARVALLLAAVALLLGALARPQFGFSWVEARSKGLDVVIAIDTSRSMLAPDVAPNRLQRAKLEAMNLKRLARTDRVGLVAFAGSAFLQCPLTLDDTAFQQSVEALDVNIIPQGGTAVAEAIAAARSAFKEGNDNHKVLVLLTDGEDHDGRALAGAQAAAKEGMRIFTIGVGTASGELLRSLDAQGRSEFIKDTEGNAVKSRLNEELLRQLAQETGGFYLLLSGANTMNVLYERGLAPLPKTTQAAQQIKRPHERYQWLLAVVLVLLLAEMFLPERPGARRTTAAGEASAAKAALVFLLAALPGLAVASPAKALRQYQAGRFEPAQTEYERALKEKPDDPRLHFNAGSAAYQAKDFAAALSHLNAALVTPDLALQQRAYYNLGNTHYRVGAGISDPPKKMAAWGQAVRSYESLLKLNPADPDAQFNLEFVKKKLEELKQKQDEEKKDQDKPPPSEAAKQAKAQADEAVRRRAYQVALSIMEKQLQQDSTTSHYGDYIQRLREINGIPAAGQP